MRRGPVTRKGEDLECCSPGRYHLVTNNYREESQLESSLENMAGLSNDHRIPTIQWVFCTDKKDLCSKIAPERSVKETATHFGGLPDVIAGLSVRNS
jgi:hypothetical protein